MPSDHYAILGVNPDASIIEINAAYKRLALKWHPDKAGDTTAATERFREITDAVEILRDPVRRGQLDYLRNSARRAQHEPQGGLSTQTSGAFDYRYSSRDYNQSRGRRHPTHKNFRHRDTFDARNDSNYMHSFGNSVHMDPNSEENKAKRAEFKEENAQWERDWKGIDPEMETLRTKFRMRPSEHGIDDMATEPGDDFLPGVPHWHSERPGFDDLSDICPESGGDSDSSLFQCSEANSDGSDTLEKDLDAGTHTGRSKSAESKPAQFKSTDCTDSIWVEDDLDFTLDKNMTRLDMNEDSYHFDKQKSTYCFTEPDFEVKVTYEARPFESNGNRDSHKCFVSCHSGKSSADSLQAHSHSADPIVNDRDTSNIAENSNKDTSTGFTDPIGNSSPTQPIDHAAIDDLSKKYSYIDYQLGTSESMKHLVPFFRQKVHKNLEKYTANDLYGEINGVVLEAYNGWLEKLRRSVKDADPLHLLNKPIDCAHLGSWKKELHREKCERCGLCAPLYLLKCPGCGLKACVRCKFTDPFFGKK
ncbi:uncharacterized protein N7511_006938 [Penicillium nucicola]|uniref:uncharacterized protein n=1 Tax=Penicillium nucicola TaxID=1850975 RepID=UPI0025455D31|nr:uncharacterized protein N7511_006938 [Penicillium nucicola]KAJ5758244.1 hypothetical protein N7511_006938 [Penicillium nucicola]